MAEPGAAILRTQVLWVTHAVFVGKLRQASSGGAGTPLSCPGSIQPPRPQWWLSRPPPPFPGGLLGLHR